MGKVTPTIRRSGAAQAARLSQISIAAKSYWGYPAQWIELWHNQLTITPAYIEKNEVWAAEVDGAILGFYALAGASPRMTLDHMWVMPVAIKQGIGSALFHHAITRAATAGAKVIEIESDPHAEGFYSKMGAETVGEVAYVLEGQRRALPLMHLMLAQPDAG
jgi:GNAT superfamily N-acetyltransferase